MPTDQKQPDRGVSFEGWLAMLNGQGYPEPSSRDGKRQPWRDFCDASEKNRPEVRRDTKGVLMVIRGCNEDFTTHHQGF